MADVKAAYPIRNHRQDHTRQYELNLGTDHLIYARSLSEDHLKVFSHGDLVPHAEALDWHLFDQLGYPFKINRITGKSHSILDENEIISEIAVASEIVVAVSDHDRVYMYKPTVLKRPIGWSAKLGAPFAGKLFLPPKRRAWTFGVSVRDKALRRVDFMHPDERVKYFTDQNGVNFDFGFTATIYVLLEDGRRITYWDTGLPPSFSRGFLTPLLGTTQGQSISAAGSTVFISVLDKDRRLRFFTRMYDYEINGACPGLAYTFKTETSSQDHYLNGTVPLGFGERKIPLEGWREHLVLDIPTQDLTSTVSIHLTGEGNSNRELRIQGTDSEGRKGYYFKRIDDLQWQFHMDESLREVPRFQFPFNPDFPDLVKDYQGQVLKAKQPSFRVGLASFHPFLTAEEPSRIHVEVEGESAEIALHSVDSWTITSHEHHYEDLVGVEEGEPKPLQGTLVLTPEQLNCNEEKSKLCQVLKKNFAPYHEQVNSFQLVATNESVYLRSNDGKLRLHFTRELTERELHDSFFMKRAREVAAITAPRGRESQVDLLELVKKTRSDLTDLHHEYAHDKRKFTAVNSISTIALPAAKAIFNFNKEDPTYEKATRDLKSPLKSQTLTEWSGLRKKNKTYKAARALLDAKILELEVLSQKPATPFGSHRFSAPIIKE